MRCGSIWTTISNPIAARGVDEAGRRRMLHGPIAAGRARTRSSSITLSPAAQCPQIKRTNRYPIASRLSRVRRTAKGARRRAVLARAGAHVAALDVGQPLAYPGYGMGTKGELDSLVDQCQAAGVECLAFAADVRDDSAVTSAVAATAVALGRIDILFNNAGICGYGLAHELTEEAWDAMLDINLKGAWFVARRIIPHMIAQRSGVIVNNSSVAGLRGMARLSHYAASKWGLTGLTKSWALDSRRITFASFRFTRPA